MLKVRVFTVSFTGATNTRGSRVKIIDTWNNGSITLDYNYNYSTIDRQVVDFLATKGICIAGESYSSKLGYILMTGNFDIKLK